MNTKCLKSNDSGKIYGFIGVSGSGKDYNSSLIRELDESTGKPVIWGDFSSGIRAMVSSLLFGGKACFDPDSSLYRQWKEEVWSLYFPNDRNGLEKIELSGRDFLKNFGEGIKHFIGKDFWASWTKNEVLSKWYSLSQPEKDASDIIFGSVRFPYEASKLFEVSSIVGKPVEIRFCNYKSEFYKISEHISDNFSKLFLDMGCIDGEDITEKVFDIISN